MIPLTWLLTCSLVLAQGVDPEPPDPNAPKARKLSAKELGLSVKRGRGMTTYKITSAKELGDAFTDEAARAAIAKQVDFKKEYVLVVAWAGSGRDQLSFTVEKGAKGAEAVLTMKRGLTRDLRQHLEVFAFPTKLPYRMGDPNR